MAVPFPYTSELQITSLVGEMGLDLRLDDSAAAGTRAADMAFAIEIATNKLDFYLVRYNQSDIAVSSWAQDHATYFGVAALCMRRLNSIPESIKEELATRIKEELSPIQKRRAEAPRIPRARRAIIVTNYSVDLRRFNNQIRVDPSKSTGVTPTDYIRPTDEIAPDER